MSEWLRLREVVETARRLKKLRITDLYNARKLYTLYRVRPYTLLPYSRLTHIYDLAVSVEVDGAVVECGVFNGGSGALLAKASGRDTWLFDSWEGMPDPSERDVNVRGLPAARGRRHGSLDKVVRIIRDLHPEGRVCTVPGWFDESLPRHKSTIGPIALLHLDCDWYESVKTCLEHLLPQVSKGGYVIFDDYGVWEGARQAAHEHFHPSEFRYLDDESAYVRVT